jgi:predicted Zn finger-like uncharacterized protein
MDDMRVGDSFNLDGQQYEYVDFFEHEILARICIIYELRTRCPDCGTSFWVTASRRQIKHRNVRRRCDACVKPGVRVNKKSSKRK